MCGAWNGFCFAFKQVFRNCLFVDDVRNRGGSSGWLLLSLLLLLSSFCAIATAAVIISIDSIDGCLST